MAQQANKSSFWISSKFFLFTIFHVAELEPESAAYQRLMTSSSSSSGSRSSPSIIPQHQSSSSSSDATSICSEATLMMASPWIRRCLRTLACCLAGMGIALWMMSFFNYIHDLHHSVYVQAQNGMEVFTACVQLAFFIIVRLRLCKKSIFFVMWEI